MDLDAKDPEGALASYAALYLKEEVQAEGLVRNIGSFARLREAISFSHGSILNKRYLLYQGVETSVPEGIRCLAADSLRSCGRGNLFRKRLERGHPSSGCQGCRLKSRNLGF